MKKVIGLATMIATFGLMTLAFAAPTTVRGYIMDKNCASKAAMKGNVECAQSCISKGAPAVLVVDKSGKVLTISNQDKVTDLEGQHVVVKGSVDGDAITVDSAHALKARTHKAAKKAAA